MSGETGQIESGWTIDTWRYHTDALRRSDELFQTERDRRYAEVAAEREKALRIKEKADDAALGLAREIQTYKDEKANELRSQIERERGTYATQADLKAVVDKLEATIKPLAEYVSSVQGRDHGVGVSWSVLVAGIAVVAVVVDVLARFIK